VVAHDRVSLAAARKFPNDKCCNASGDFRLPLHLRDSLIVPGNIHSAPAGIIGSVTTFDILQEDNSQRGEIPDDQ